MRLGLTAQQCSWLPAYLYSRQDEGVGARSLASLGPISHGALKWLSAKGAWETEYFVFVVCVMGGGEERGQRGSVRHNLLRLPLPSNVIEHHLIKDRNS